MQEQILPCNYLIAGNESEEDPEKLIRKWFVYLQRGDIWKALSYCDLYSMDEEWYPDSVFFSRQSAAAATLQKIYYDLLLSDANQMSWIYQNVKDEAVNLVSLSGYIQYGIYLIDRTASIGSRGELCKISGELFI